jgi:Derlin-2/3
MDHLGLGGMGQAGAGVDLMSWYMEIPPVSRLYLTGAFLTTAGCALEVISPYTLFFNYDLVFEKGQVWRLITSYLFFGVFSVDFLFHMYFLVRIVSLDCLYDTFGTRRCGPMYGTLRCGPMAYNCTTSWLLQVRYSRLLEEGDFRGRTANYVLFLLFGIFNISIVASKFNVEFLGSALTFMMAYVWGRRNEDVKMSFLGFLTFHAPYLPWVMLTFSMLLGNSILMDLIGICVGHAYFFLEFVFPVLADARGWQVRRVMEPPAILRWLCGDRPEDYHVRWHED